MKKVIEQKQSEIFEKVVTKNGKLFLVRFVILEREGRLRGKVISCEAIETLSGSTGKATKICLPLFRTYPTVTDEGLTIKDCVLSPFSTLEFFMSQPTRAPSLA